MKKGEKHVSMGRERKPWISTIKASKLLCQGCIGYCCYAIDTQTKEEEAGNIPVVYEFGDVFPEELSEVSPQMEIDFVIELIPGA